MFEFVTFVLKFSMFYLIMFQLGIFMSDILDFYVADCSNILNYIHQNSVYLLYHVTYFLPGTKFLSFGINCS